MYREQESLYKSQRAKEEGLKKDDGELDILFKSRQEYIDGKIPLKFEYSFKNGDKFIANDNVDSAHNDLEQDLPEIKIVRGSESLVDFGKIAKSLGIRLITPSFVQVHEQSFDPKYIRGIKSEVGRWLYLDKKYIPNSEWSYLGIGDMKDPREIFALLHELGHCVEEAKSGSLRSDKLPLSNEQRNDFGIRISFRERNANAAMINFVRRIKAKTGLDLLEIFPTKEAFLNMIYLQLANARFRSEFAFGRKQKEELPSKEVLQLYELFFDKGKAKQNLT